MAFLDEDDLAPFAADIDSDKAEQMIADATALAVLAAPCLGTEEDLTEAQTAAVKAVLRGAVLRWHDAGSGVLTQESTGPFSQSLDTRQPRRGMFWPSEIQQLQDICGEITSGGAFSIDSLPECTGGHADICAVNFGATYCSCGAVLAGWPLYETT